MTMVAMGLEHVFGHLRLPADPVKADDDQRRRGPRRAESRRDTAVFSRAVPLSRISLRLRSTISHPPARCMCGCCAHWAPVRCAFPRIDPLGDRAGVAPGSAWSPSMLSIFLVQARAARLRVADVFQIVRHVAAGTGSRAGSRRRKALSAPGRPSIRPGQAPPRARLVQPARALWPAYAPSRPRAPGRERLSSVRSKSSLVSPGSAAIRSMLMSRKSSDRPAQRPQKSVWRCAHGRSAPAYRRKTSEVDARSDRSPGCATPAAFS